MQTLFKGLNPAQLSAVTATEGYVRIIAGAGSGKTRTLTHRYAYLVKAAGIHPSGILCVTFTNKAASEMKRRVRALIGDGYDNALITTYHGFCVRVLREDIFRLFYPQSFLILDEGDQKRLLSEIYAEMDLKMDRATFEKILALVHRSKADDSYVYALIDGQIDQIPVLPTDPARPPEPVEIEIVRRYLARQKKLFSLDFDDLVAFTFALFRRYPEVLAKWADRLTYIQVDEFQDSSARELRLLSMLANTHKNLFVVGDPDQNIYEWRGADMSILLDFDKTFPGTQTVLLNQNYRSTGHILTCANTLIEKNKNRIPKDLFTAGVPGPEVLHFHGKTEKEEGAFLIEQIQKLSTGGMPYKHMAILYRAGFLSRFVEQALMAHSIPYELYGSVRFYERMEIQDALAYAKLVLSDDDEALVQIINTPRRSFGKTKLNALRTYAQNDGCSLLEALRRYQTAPVFARSSVGTLVALLDGLRLDVQTKSASEVLTDVLTLSGYEDYIRQNGSMERLDNLAELKRTAVQYEQDYGEHYTLPMFLQQVMLESDRDEDEDADRVKLMTIHASKGLEFPAVFVTGMTEGIFPSSRTIEERKEAGLEEERRLCFVAITRAMEHLYLTESEGHTSDSKGSSVKRPSRFLYDMGEDNYVRLGVIPTELCPTGPSATGDDSSTNLSIGDVVQHPVFGRGTVVELDPGKRVYYILFESGARRPVSMDYDFAAGMALTQALEQLQEANDTIAKAEPSPEPAPTSEPIRAPAQEATQEPVQEPEPTPAPICEPAPEPVQEPADTGAPLPTTDEMPMRYRHAEWAREPDGDETNLWKRDDVPHEGWECTGIIDLGAPVGICRMCGHQIIRYVHIMKHPNYHRTIGAGCVCAGRMEGDMERARARETAFKNRQSRRDTFLHLPRKRSRNGHEYIKYHGEIITLLEDKYKKGQWKTAFRNGYSASFATKEEALASLFDEIDNNL